MHARGAQVAGARALLKEIAAVRGTIEPSATARSLDRAHGAGGDDRLDGTLPTTYISTAKNREPL